MRLLRSPSRSCIDRRFYFVLWERIIASNRRVTRHMLRMTPQEFVAFRKQLGWSLATLSRHIGITASRLADYETGHTRGKDKKPAPIPEWSSLPASGSNTSTGR